MFNKNEIWSKIVSNLKSEISQPQLSSWLFKTSLKNLDRNIALIEVPNKFFATWMTDNCISKIQKSFNESFDFLPEIRFSYKKSKMSQTLLPFSQYNTIGDNIVSSGLNPSWTFNSFITDNSNEFAYSSSLKVSKKPREHFNPLYIFCKHSFGKTHLLNAIGNEVKSENPYLNIKYYSAEQFYSDFSFSIRNQKLDEFREKQRSLDFFLLDDIHFFGGRNKSQIELLHLFNSLYESGKQMVFAGKTHPLEIENLLPQLRSRFEGGILSEIQVPDPATKIMIIKEKAKKENVDIQDDVVFFLANTNDDFKNLNQFIVNIKNYISLYKRSIDISMVKSIIKNKDLNKITVSDIQKITSEYFDLSLYDLLSNNKKRKFSYPRHVAMYLSRILTESSFKDIATAFGNMNHSSVIYAVKSIEKEKDINKILFDDINKLCGFLS
ncbi:MAG: chromosomal replication initiator protein DnaA [Deltaproteobacteria bacterium]|nr:chromosomal replication initiator protein DnaA [Deltaproteobacteria bacterium]